ncbi:hypothetical protein HY375_02950 [Candidatus Berkelbacteria bacterium]|nr:hypothetical protein [Candidatus Berkelbacteria bacterium]
MQSQITDPEVRNLAAIASLLKSDYIREGELDPWAGSPFAWIRSLPSRKVGKIGEELVSGWTAAKGLDVTRSGDSEADRVINGKRVEIKFSTLWESGIYNFQQLRDQAYDYAICLGISPFSAHCWVIPKVALKQHVIGHTPQHGGATGKDTAWLQFPAEDPSPWLKRYGGRLAEALHVLKRF